MNIHQLAVNAIGEISATNSGVSIWPNPAVNAGAMIRIPDKLRGFTFSLYDQQGRKVRQLLLQDAVTQLNTIELAPGMYVYHIAGGEQLHSGKLVIRN